MKQDFFPPAVLQQLLRAAGPGLVLVGGQALAFWMDRYDVSVPGELPAITRDIDFLTPSAADRGEVLRLASVLQGQAVFPSENSLTALVGQAVRSVGDDGYLNIDVIFRVFGNSAAAVRDHALRITDADQGLDLWVMHPLDVLKSRLDNLYGLKEKQTLLGEAHLRAAIEVVQRAQHDQHQAQQPDPERKAASPTLPWVHFIAKLARDDAGKKRWRSVMASMSQTP